jgi:Carbohydrate binding module (family 6)
VSCPGGASEQEWWLAKAPTSSQSLEIQGRQCGSWLAFIEDGASALYEDVDLGAREGELRLRVVVAAEDRTTSGGTLTLFADADTTTPVISCAIQPTGGWFNWLVVDCGPLSLRGRHSLTFKFNGTAQYVFNFAAFGVVRSGSPDCTVTGPKFED